MNFDKEEFFKRLYMLAEISNFKLNDYLCTLYDNNLKVLGYEKVCRVIERLIVDRKSNAPFPSIADISQIINPRPDPKIEALSAVDRVITAVSKFGYMRGDEAKDFVGDLGWVVVRQYGGWSSLCEVLTNSELGMFRAQMREFLIAHVTRIEMGITGPPKLPEVKSDKMLDISKLALGKKEDVGL